MADNVPINPGNATGTPIATDDIGGVQYQRVKICYGDGGSATDASAANPLPVTITGSGGLTDAQLRASAVPVSGTFYPATQPVSGTVGVSGSVAVTGSFYQATQPVSIASMPSTPVTGTFYPATQPISGNVGVTGSVAVTGTFWQATQPVSGTVAATQSGTWNIGSITTLPALVAGTALIGKAGIDQTTPGTTNAVSVAQIGATTVATGNGAVSAGVQRVAIASDNTAFAVNATGPTLTKATQGSTGFSVQDLKDAGRVSFAAATVIGGVTSVSTEALLTMVPVRAGTASGTSTTIAVTSGKRLRIQAITVSARSTGATVLSARFALRINPSGAVAANSPILALLSCTQQAAALAEAGDSQTVAFPDGLEFSGTEQIGITQVCSGTAGQVYVSIIGYEY